MNTPTTAISKFLDKLIRPIFDKHARSTTIIDGVDLIRRLEKYHTNGYLKPTTLLCTFDITDLYTMLPQEESLNVLMEFLSHHGYQKVMSVPIMKTCALHNLKVRSKQENLFSMNLPEAHYGMKQCRDKTCRFCYERLDLTNRFERAMHFTNSQMFRSINNYQVYLNCDVVSHSVSL